MPIVIDIYEKESHELFFGPQLLILNGWLHNDEFFLYRRPVFSDENTMVEFLEKLQSILLDVESIFTAKCTCNNRTGQFQIVLNTKLEFWNRCSWLQIGLLLNQAITSGKLDSD